MRIGTQTNSLVNHIHARATVGQPTPVVGMGVTLLGWTDRNAGTIVAVRTEGKFTYIEVQEDNATLDLEKSGPQPSETQVYTYAPNPDAYRQTFRAATPDGAWTEVYKAETGRWRKRDGRGLRLGHRNAYRDPSF